MTHSPFCSDFGFAHGPRTDFHVEVAAAADASGFPPNGEQQKFINGYRHAHFGTSDFRGRDAAYDAGFAACLERHAA